MVGHSGGYPGFGSKMDWHPSSGVGVIGLANGRYGGPYTAVQDALAAVVAERPSQVQLQPHTAVSAIRSAIDNAVITGNLWLLEPLFAANVAMDEPLAERGSFFFFFGACRRRTPRSYDAYEGIIGKVSTRHFARYLQIGAESRYAPRC